MMGHRMFYSLLSCLVFCLASAVHSPASQPIDQSFTTPPREFGVRCWWWWLNGNVTKEAITRDLEEMIAKGFSGAMIFDAGGAEQRGNSQVPAGPTFASPAWVELYLHALNEAQRLGLEMGLSIQSGWNLGGPFVTPDFAAKQITFTETQVTGPATERLHLPKPSHRDGFYKDICVLAYKKSAPQESPIQYEVKTSSAQSEFTGFNAFDGDPATFWVSGGNQPGEGPTEAKPEWYEVHLSKPLKLSKIQLKGRDGYGPRACKVYIASDGAAWRLIGENNAMDSQPQAFRVPKTQVQSFRFEFTAAQDPRYPDNPRNVQVADITLLDPAGNPVALGRKQSPIQNLSLKTMVRELGGSAPDCRFLLDDLPATPGEEDVKAAGVQDLTSHLQEDGSLDWQAPEGEWTVLRFGYTVTDAHVSTYSADWHGRVIDYLSPAAFDRYWDTVVTPLLDSAGPLVGTVLKQLETDSWECGGMNWTPAMRAEFQRFRGYDLLPYMPIFAGKIVEDRETSNRFLADFRKTLGDCVAHNHYAHFAERAKVYTLGIQPESGGPHAGPFDAIKNLGFNDIVMGEFWVPSPHRPKPDNRFFIKQASSVAHIHGKKYVGAESFTSIGPHWEDVLWQSLKPSADHEYASGLNMVFFHTFTCSPKEMGLPGQEYFAGTHFNP
ncbi:MAG: glycosyl hydrolase, partial [bacterium]|nr:glycosyl hydrolase [bacterium]